MISSVGPNLGGKSSPSSSAAPVAVLTRPAGQAAALGEALSRRGWEVADWPALEIATRPATDLPLVEDASLVLFVSGNAVRHFAQQRAARGLTGWPPHVPVATVGPVSAAACAILGAGIEVVHPPADSPSFDSEALWRELGRRNLQPRRVLIVRGGDGAQGSGRGWLAERWRSAGAKVILHSAYERRPVPWPPERQTWLRERQARRRVTWLWSSGEALAAVAGQWGEAALTDTWRGGRLLATHARVATAIDVLARRRGLATAWSRTDAGAERQQDLILQVCLPQDDAVLAAFVD
ncbi:MAG: uroporphyrinogen-III synthase [Pigmentiphaga sp.]